jgi:hypothetical protein
MFIRGGFLRFFFTLVLVGVLIAGGVALYQAGFGQGYAAGLTANTDHGTTAIPNLPAYGYAPFWFGFPFFHPFGIFLGIGFFLFVFFVIGGLLRFGGMRRRWADGGHFGHHPYWDRPGENQPKEGTDKSAEAKESPPKS